MNQRKDHAVMGQLTRRRIVALLAMLPAFAAMGRAQAAASAPKITVTKDPNCGCCGGWVDHLKAEGFAVEVIETAALDRVKAKLGVPNDLAACHTAEVEGYVIEGHVPAVAIRRLLSEKPQAKGIAVPGMPVGSPGMEVEGSAPEIYDVLMFDAFGQRLFARFQGARELQS
jgi:hypothetical protein